MVLGGLAGLIAPAGLLAYGIVRGAPDPVLVLVFLIIGGMVTLGMAGWVIGRGDDALAARNRELALLGQELHALAVTDALTGLPNRRAFDNRLATEVALASRYQRPLSLVMLDLDRFKEVNDRHGHAVGDAVLRQVAAILQRQRRSGDLVARYGGEELVAILPHTEAEAAAIWAERVRRAIAALVVTPAGARVVTASFGVAGFEAPHWASVEALLTAADAALYEAKRDGRNCVRVHNSSRDDHAAAS